MDMTSLMISFMAGLISMGMIMYAKSAGRLVPLAAGLGLAICPYVITNVVILLAVCAGFTALPFVLRDA